MFDNPYMDANTMTALALKPINVQPNSRYNLKIDIENGNFGANDSLFYTIAILNGNEYAEQGFTATVLTEQATENIIEPADLFNTHTLSFTTDAATNNIVLQVFMMLNDSTQNNLYFTINNITLEQVSGGLLYTINPHSSLNKYRFGFGSHEKDNEVSGVGNHYNFNGYGLDTRLGRRWNIDPKTAKAPSESPYLVFGDNPIFYIDPDGKYKLPASVQKDYPMLTLYISKYVEQDVMSSSVILQAFDKNTAANNPSGTGNLTPAKVKETVIWKQGPMIVLKEKPGGMAGANGYYNSSTGNIELSKGRIDALEKVLASDASEADKQKALSAVYMTLLHETTHYGDYLDGLRQDGGEPGEDFEDDVWRNKTVEVDGEKIPNVRYSIGDKYDSGEMQIIMDEKKQTEEGKKTFPTVPQK